jgi:hypothetical protein
MPRHGKMIRNIQKFTSVVLFVALFDAVVNQILFWTNDLYHTAQIATRIGNAGLLAFAAVILLLSIHNYKQIQKENA